MSQEIQEREPASFFARPAFWMGCVMWIGVLAVVWVGRQNKRADSNAEPQATQQNDSEEQPKKIVIGQDKNGELTISDGKDTPPATAWDADGIADFAFIDTEGQTKTKADFLGKPWIVCFVFTHCAATCPTVTKSMRDLQDQLKNYDFRMVTVTVDPERDTPEVLKGYGERFGADFSKWSFLGGNQRDIYHLIHGSFKMPVQELKGKDRQVGFEFIHSNNIMLVDENGVVVGKFDATKGPDMSDLRREIQKLAKPLQPTPEGDSPETTEPTPKPAE